MALRRDRRSSRAVIVALGSRAAENSCSFRRQIGFQPLPRHERDILALDIGADRVGRIMKGQTGTFCLIRSMARSSLARCLYAAFDKRIQARQVILDDVPDDNRVSFVIGVS